MEQFEAIKQREAETNAELSEARAAAREATEAFNFVRTRRTDMFTSAFDHCKEAIDAIYKELTRSPLHPMGEGAAV